MATTTTTFAPGSQVHLLSGGPTMTVDTVRSVNHGVGFGPAAGATATTVQEAKCVWFAGIAPNQTLQLQEFATTSLIAALPPNPAAGPVTPALSTPAAT